MRTQPPLTNLQLEILKLYSFELTEKDLLDLKNVLARHFADRLSKRVDEIWQEKGLTEADMDKWLNDENQ
jgi:predicted transcriptional regulator